MSNVAAAVKGESNAPQSTDLDLVVSAPSLCTLPPNWKTSFTLKELINVAKRSNAHSSWLKIRKKTILIELLDEKVKEHSDFLRTVQMFAFQDYLQMGIDKCVGARILPILPRRRTQITTHEKLPEMDLGEGIRSTLEAAVHIIPSGSGVHIGNGLILTCAHCVIHDDYDDENDTDIAKKGRVVELVNASGQTFGAVCIDSSIKSDIAMLQIPTQVLEVISLGSIKLAERGADIDGTQIFALGNPCDLDLEARTKEEALRKNGYFPFHVSEGKLERKITSTQAKKMGLGTQIHSAWTYWGHSGCPLVALMTGESGNDNTVYIVGLHNSWDDQNGNRHGVSLDELLLFCRHK